MITMFDTAQGIRPDEANTTPVTKGQLQALEQQMHAALALGQRGQAESCCEWLVLHDAQQPRHWRTLARLAQGRGDASLALKCWHMVRRLEPQSLDALFQIGCCHALKDEPAQAYLAFDALAKTPSAAQALRQRAARLAELVDPIDI